MPSMDIGQSSLKVAGFAPFLPPALPPSLECTAVQTANSREPTEPSGLLFS